MKYYGNEPLIEGSLSHTLKPLDKSYMPPARVDLQTAPLRGRFPCPVKRTNKEGKARCFNSVSQAAAYSNKKDGTIRACLRTGKRDRDGYLWEYINE